MTFLIIIGLITGIYMYCCLSSPNINTCIIFCQDHILHVFLLYCAFHLTCCSGDTKSLVYLLPQSNKKNYQINSFFKLKKLGEGLKIKLSIQMFSQLIFPYLNAWFKVLYWNFSGASPTTTAFASFVSIPYKKKLSNLFQFHYLYYI